MTLSCPTIFDENRPISWRMASAGALLAAVTALHISPELSLINAGVSLSAGAVSLMLRLLSFKIPKGSLALGTILFFSLWLSPLAELSPEQMRIVLGLAIVCLSLVYQGAVIFFSAVLVLGFGFLLPNMTLDLKGHALGAVLLDDSFQWLQLSLAAGVAILCLRISRARTNSLQAKLLLATDDLQKTRSRFDAINDSVLQTRESLLGRVLSQGEVSLNDTISELPLENLDSCAATFEDVIAIVRKSFADFQVQGRTDGLISGPIRFVFFAPAAGYDEKSLIAADLASLVGGVEACLKLALESLPEIGARKREGVIRLSIRYGLRVIEISVEDNGRGLIARNPEAERNLNRLKDLTTAWGGTFDRLARLGVGSRTSLELRIVRERRRVHPATLKHRLPVDSRSVGVPRG